MERDIIYYHIAIQQIEQLNKQCIFIKLNDHYHIYKKHKSKCPYDVEERNKPEILRHKKKLELKANMDRFFQMKGVYLISTLIEKRVNVFRAINNESKET